MKKRLILILCLGLFLLSGCVKKQSEKEYIGILSAMDNEVRLLLSETEVDHVDTLGGVEYHVGTLSGKDVVIARAGVGKVLAASGAAAMLDKYPISALIFTGIAGGVGEETAVLDIVIGDELVQHDFGNMTNDGFQWTPPFNSGGSGFYECDERLIKPLMKRRKK